MYVKSILWQTDRNWDICIYSSIILLRYRDTISYEIPRVCIANKRTKSFSMFASYKKKLIIKQIHIILTLRGPWAVLYFDLSQITIAHLNNKLFVSIIRSFMYRILLFVYFHPIFKQWNKS